MNRRALLKALGSSVLFSGGFLPPLVFAQTVPNVISPLLHVFGTLPEPVEIQRVFAAGAPAGVLLNSLTPKQLLGWPMPLSEKALPWLSESSRHLPVIGRLAGRGSTINTEQLMALKPDVIVDVGDVNEYYLGLAKQLTQQTGIPYVLVAGRIEDSPEQLRQLGALLGHQRHGQQLAQAAQGILDEITEQKQAYAGNVPSMYLARSADGLETGMGDSIHSEIIRLVGAKNVAQDQGGQRLGRVSIEQLMVWDPDIILTQELSFFKQVYANPLWQGLKAIQNKKVLFVPSVPFGWIDVPPSINRLFGAQWLANYLYSGDQEQLLEKVRHLFILFFAVDPGAERIRALVTTPEQFA